MRPVGRPGIGAIAEAESFLKPVSQITVRTNLKRDVNVQRKQGERFM